MSGNVKNSKKLVNAKFENAVDKILDVMENSGEEWVKAWSSHSLGMPFNESTKNRYRGINVLLLFVESFMMGYRTNRFMTFKQAKEMGGSS